MPELPEVETVCRGIAPVLEGRTLTRVLQRRANLRIPFPADFVTRLEGRRVAGIGRRAKFLLAGLDDGATLLIHLGMSGSFGVHPGGARLGDHFGRHDHVVLETDAGDRLVYNDPRRFGFITLLPPGEAERSPWLAKLGPEPLGNAFAAEELSAVLAKRRTPIKAVLLDQAVVAGLGNIYVCEALYRAGISPERPAETVAGADAARLVPIIKTVLQEAITAGGSTLRDFAQVDGTLGYFQHRFQVYGREGEPCATPGCALPIERIVQSGRSTFFCRGCQS